MQLKTGQTNAQDFVEDKRFKEVFKDRIFRQHGVRETTLGSELAGTATGFKSNRGHGSEEYLQVDDGGLKQKAVYDLKTDKAKAGNHIEQLKTNQSPGRSEKAHH